jgi:crotonobetainyl-CoA:carnitine CoA-transferase CaiB-like acyl-CoA transferase
LPSAQGSLHPNIAPYGELFLTADEHCITFAIGSDKQFKNLCSVLNLNLFELDEFASNQARVTHREKLFELLVNEIKKINFDTLFSVCLQHDIPIGKIRNLKEVFELPEAQHMLCQLTNNQQNIKTVSSIGFKFL